MKVVWSSVSLGLVFSLLSCASNLILSFIFLPHFARAEAPQVSTGIDRATILRDFKLEQLDTAATILRVAVDRGSDSDTKSELDCNLGPEEALAFAQPLKSLIDQKQTEREKDLFSFMKSAKNRVQAFKGCEINCHCGVYSNILEQHASGLKKGKKLSPVDQKTLKELNKAAAAVTTERAVTCIEKENWFCTSRLLQFLKQEAPVAVLGEAPPDMEKKH